MWQRLCFGLVILLSSLAPADTVSVSAAISLKETLTEIGHQYEAATGGKVDLNFGASGTLAAQIQQGAPVDLFISAGGKQVDELIKAGLAYPQSRTSIAANRLVLIVPKDSRDVPAKFEDLADPRYQHIAIGEPGIVPAGDYAMQTFASLHLDKLLADRLVMGENVRQVLSYITRGEANAGVVYATDAAAAGDAVHIAATAPESTHQPIVYPAIIISAGNHARAEKFLDFLGTPQARAALISHGFTLPPEPATRP